MLTVDMARLEDELREVESKSSECIATSLEFRLALLQARIDLVRLKLELEGK